MLGPGLIGGSVLMAARRRFPAMELRAWARRADSVDRLASMKGLVDLATGSLSDAVAGADCVILAMPTGAMGAVVRQLGRFPLGDAGEPVLVTDVGSVKGAVMEELAPLVAERGGRFIGSHPMAGSERVGLEFAESELFEGAAVILTPGEDDGQEHSALARLADFWTALGGRVSVMEAARHDELVAAISHLPHLVAAALVRTVMKEESGAADFCAGGFRDTTRVSAGPEEMWSGILADNHLAVSARLGSFIEELKTWKAMLDSLDRKQLRVFLSQARELRERI